jgi:hypothetical protein
MTLIAAPLMIAKRIASRSSRSGSAGSVGGSLPREPSFQVASTAFLATAVAPSVLARAATF